MYYTNWVKHCLHSSYNGRGTSGTVMVIENYDQLYDHSNIYYLHNKM
jgi:hypothetical protein